MTLEHTARWETTNEQDGDATIYSFGGYLLKMRHIMGRELNHEQTLVPVVEEISAEVVSPDGTTVMCDSRDAFIVKMEELELPLYLDKAPIVEAA